MNPWEEFIKFGCVVYASYPGVTGAELFSAIERVVADPDFEVIEVTRVSDPPVRQRVRDLLASTKRMVVFSGGPVYVAERVELGARDVSVRKRSLEKAKRLVDEAIEFNAQRHLVGSGPDPGMEAREEARGYLVDSLTELCDYARANSESPLMLTLEPFDRDVAIRALIGPTEEAVVVASEVKRRTGSFGITLDLSHVAQLGEDPSEAVEKAAKVIAHAHLSSCYLGDPSHPSYGDQHVRFDFPGAAVSEKTVVRYLQALHENGVFRPGRLPVSLEVKPQPGEDRESILSGAKRSFIRAWQMAEIARQGREG
jgi:sugar phosphate isomerase/epimerase